MAVTFTAANASVSATALDIVSSAFLEAAILAAGEPISAANGAWGLEKLQRLIDQFNTRREMIYNVNFSRYTLLVNHSPHTIGPGGDFDVPTRPVKIVGAAFVLTSGGQAIDTPIAIRDDDWWRQNTVKDQTSTIATHLYYSPDIPRGSAYFWPKVSVAGDVRLETWVNLTQAINLATNLAMPQGYWDAVVTELAIQLCPSYEKEPSAALVRNNRQAMQAILSNNLDPPRICTAGQGIPDSSMVRHDRPDFNFLTGLRE